MTAPDIVRLRQQTEAEPLAPASWRALGLALQRSSPGDEATACLCAAAALEGRSSLALYNLATVYFQARRFAEAERWYRLTLALDPLLVEAHQNLAVVLNNLDQPDEAQRHRDDAFSRQSVFVEPARWAGAVAVLILSGSALGNVPIDWLLPRDRYTRIKWFTDYAQTDALAHFDVVFNALGDSDITAKALEAASGFLQSCDKPVLNPPDRIRATTRDQIPGLLAAIDDLVVPKTTRWDGVSSLGEIGLPVLVRPIGSHGGQGVVKVDTPDGFATVKPQQSYLTPYHDYRSADGLFRKYRVIFIDRVPYAYHLAISAHWLVHYFSADMAKDDGKRAEEQRFLENPERTLGACAWAAVAAIGRRLDLDYGGLDFGLLADGRVLVFEANATMLAHLGDDAATFGYKHQTLPALFDAFHRMVDGLAKGAAAKTAPS